MLLITLILTYLMILFVYLIVIIIKAVKGKSLVSLSKQ